MEWITLLAILVVGYYIIKKSQAKVKEKCFSIFSLIFLILAMPLWNDRLFDAVINISVFLPFVLGIFGIIWGSFGIKGNVRLSLIGLNVFAFAFYLIIFLMGTIGFQEP